MRSPSATPSVVVLNDTRVDHHHGCSRVMAALETLVSGMGARIGAAAPAHTDWTNNAAVGEALRSCRLVVVNGEGTLHHDSRAGLKLLEAGRVARELGVPSVLVNCGWEANGPEYFALLRQFTRVCARDARSAAEIRAAGVACDVVPDLSLYLPHRPAPAQRRGVGFTDSVVRDVSLSLEALRRACGGTVAPVQFAPAGARGNWRYFREYVGRSDLARPGFLARMLDLRLRQRRAQAATADAYIERLAQLELLVSGRFHSCTLAMVAGTPFVAVSSNSHKIESLVSDAGLAAWRVAGELSLREIEQARAAGWSPAERAAMADYLDRARRGADALFGEIRKLL